MTALIRSALTEIHNSRLNPEIQDTLRSAEVVKIAAVATAIACTILFAVFPSLGIFCLLFPIAYASYEIGTIANNLQKILENPLKALLLRSSHSEAYCQQYFLNRLIERTLIAKSIVKLRKPFD